jgi:hypothetical protein
VNRAALAESGVTGVLGAICLVEGLRLTHQSLLWKDPVGPGWFLVAVAIALFVVTALLFVSRNDRAPASTAGAPSVPLWRSQPMQLVAAFMAYCAVVSYTGYLIASFAFFTLALRIAGVSTWPRSVVIGAVIAGAFYAFCRSTEIPLP